MEETEVTELGEEKDASHGPQVHMLIMQWKSTSLL